MNWAVVKGKTPFRVDRPSKRKHLDELIALAKEMEIGDAAIMRSSEASTFRVILTALGFDCVTDGWRCEVHGKTLAFKLERKTDGNTTTNIQEANRAEQSCDI